MNDMSQQKALDISDYDADIWLNMAIEANPDDILDYMRAREWGIYPTIIFKAPGYDYISVKRHKKRGDA